MVLADEPITGELVICSAWGPDADWVRNLQAGSAREAAWAATDSCHCTASSPTTKPSRSASPSAKLTPRRLRLISTILGWGDLRSDDAVRSFVQRDPFVGLRPTAGLRETHERRWPALRDP